MQSINQRIYSLYGYRVEYVHKQKRLAKEKGLDIYQSALERLYDDGFKIEQDGSIYIAKLIEDLYHERELLKKYSKRPSYLGYWDLKDIHNPHYYPLGDAREIQEEMRKSIISSSCEQNDADINELIYDLSDREIIKHNYLYQDDPRLQAQFAPSYCKSLRQYYK